MEAIPKDLSRNNNFAAPVSSIPIEIRDVLGENQLLMQNSLQENSNIVDLKEAFYAKREEEPSFDSESENI